MKIGIDCRTISEPAGIGEYTRQIVKHLIEQNSDDQFVLFFVDAATAQNYRQPNVKVIILPFYKYKKYLPLVYSQLIVPIVMWWQQLDVCWFPANIIPLLYFRRSVVTVHDLAVYKIPELFPDSAISLDRRILVPVSLRRASKIIAVSQSTKNDIMEIFKIAATKITVVYEGGNFDYDRQLVSSAIPVGLETKTYFLFIGTIEPRKNLLLLIAAYKNFVQAGNNDFDLVLAGKSGWKNEEIFAAIKSVNQTLGEEKIKYLGFISNEEKVALYQSAYALILPSKYEGFGLPAAEALQFNLPLILANNSALPEIGGEAALYIDSGSESSILGVLQEITHNSAGYEKLKSEAHLRASQFAWESSAEEVNRVLGTII